MTRKSPSVPVDDPDQLAVDAVEGQEHYLGNAAVVHKFVGDFAREVIAAYDLFLQGQEHGPDVQAKIAALVTQYGDALMGRDAAYHIAPWQGKRLTGKFLATIDGMKGGDEPGEALFRSLALSCINAAIAVARGMDQAAAGARLKEVLDDARGRILGVIV